MFLKKRKDHKKYIKERTFQHIIHLYKAQGTRNFVRAMALDNQADDDPVFQAPEFTFLIYKDLFEQAKPVTVDYHEALDDYRFRVHAGPDTRESCAGQSRSAC